MPTTRTVQTPSLTAAAPTVFTADGTGDKFRIPDSGCFMRITNGGGASITATLDDPTSVSPEGAQSWNPDVQWTVPNGTSRVVRIADAKRFNNAAVDGLASVAWSSATSVTFELYS